MTILTVTMPRLGETMDEGVVVNWLVAAGQTFKRGDSLVEIETDKTLVEIPALGDGTMVETMVTPDTKLRVGEPIARITPADAADWDEVNLNRVSEAEVSKKTPQPAVTASTAKNQETPLRATPLARRLARSAGLDINSIQGSGRRNRIEQRDIEAALSRSRVVSKHAADPHQNNTVVLIHGFAGSGRTWSRLVTMMLQDGMAVVAPDLPGHGSNETAATDLSSLVADMQRFLAGIAGNLQIVGHSLGGAVATMLAAEATDRVASLTLIAPAGIGRDISVPFVSGMASVQTAGELEHLLSYLGRQGRTLSGVTLAEMADELLRGRLREIASVLAGPLGQRISILRTLEAVADQIPVKVVFGLEDKVIPAAQATNAPPAVAVHYIAGAGHMPQWDAPETVLKLIKQGSQSSCRLSMPPGSQT